MKPGVNGPTATPASTYPMMAGRRRRVATKPPASATTRATLIVAISSVSCGIRIKHRRYRLYRVAHRHLPRHVDCWPSASHEGEQGFDDDAATRSRSVHRAIA